MTATAQPVLELLRPLQPLTYAEGLQLQAQMFDRIVTARAAGGDFAGGAILLEHLPTITLGREATPGELLAPAAALRAQGIEVTPTDRGGKVTVHAPGQWVLYPVVDLQRFDRSVTGHIRRLEEVAIRTAARFGVTARRIEGVSGAWIVKPGQPDEKLCAVGIAVRKWITRHGLCFNVAAEMPVYRHIVACGQVDRGIASLQRLTGRGDAGRLMAETAEVLLAEFATVFGVALKLAMDSR